MENQTVYGQNMLISQTFIATAWKGVKIKHIHTFPAALAAAHRGGREKEQNLGRYVEGSRRKLVGRKLRPKNKCCQLFGFISALSAGTLFLQTWENGGSITRVKGYKCRVFVKVSGTNALLLYLVWVDVQMKSIYASIAGIQPNQNNSICNRMKIG